MCVLGYVKEQVTWSCYLHHIVIIFSEIGEAYIFGCEPVWAEMFGFNITCSIV